MKEHIDITIYINNIKEFLNKNKEAAKYFYGDLGEDLFYEKVRIFATENYKEIGTPELSIKQFEEVRQAIIVKFGTENISSTIQILPFSLN